MERKPRGKELSRYLDDTNVYLTTDRGRTAYFILNGEQFIGCIPALDPLNEKRSYFVLVNIEERRTQELEDRWLKYAPEMMSARSYFEAMKQVTWAAKNPMSLEQYNTLRGEA